MIVVDIPRGNKSSPQYQNQDKLKSLIRSMGVECDSTPLSSGDAAFTGYGPDGEMAIGVERKALHDMLNCIDDSSYSGHQRINMRDDYRVSFLLIEGYWKSREDGLLMESRDGCQWWLCRPHGKPVMYSKIRRYIISLSHSGVIVNYTQNLKHTAQDICEIYHYHQKKWTDHTSLLEVRKLAIPQMNRKPNLALRWAFYIDGLGAKLAPEAARVFKRGITLATADEQDWLRVPGVGIKKAQSIVKEIHDL